MDFAALLAILFFGMYTFLAFLCGWWLAGSLPNSIAPVLMFLLVAGLLNWGIGGSPALHLVLLTVGVGLLLAIRAELRALKQVSANSVN